MNMYVSSVSTVFHVFQGESAFMVLDLHTVGIKKACRMRSSGTVCMSVFPKSLLKSVQLLQTFRV